MKRAREYESTLRKSSPELRKALEGRIHTTSDFLTLLDKLNVDDATIKKANPALKKAIEETDGPMTFTQFMQSME